MKLFSITKLCLAIIPSIIVYITCYSQDDCATATSVTDLTGVVCATSSVSATNAISAGSCEEGTFDTWFSFVAQGPTADVTVTATTSGFRPEIVMFESDDNTCSGGFYQIGCGDGTGNYNSLTVSGFSGLVNGNTYWIVISSDGNTTSGTLSVCVTNPITSNPNNDFCQGAVNLPLNGTCVNGTNVNANDEYTGAAGCQNGAVATHPDVFYSFTADNPSISFTLNNGTIGGTGELVLYSGDCYSTFTPIGSLCGTMPFTDTINALVVGGTYYVGISSSGSTGTFQLCATSFVPTASPGQDCPDAQLLCDNSQFTIGTIASGAGTITGNGSNEDLTFTGSCFGGQESRAQWYKFSVNTTGDLEFQIDPILWGDDYDWALFDISTTGCVITNNVPISCNWSACYGMTGITSNVASYTGGSTGASDYYYANPPGAGDCLGVPGGPDSGNGASQWENAVTVTAGKQYAIVINNYGTAASDNGFNFTFDGTSALIGVSAGFKITGGGCSNYNVSIQDTIAALNTSTYSWDWGDGTPVANGPATNTHDYTLAGPGVYNVHIVVTDLIGCTKDYYITVSVGTTLAANAGNDVAICNGNNTLIGGAPSATGGNGIYTYSWTPNDGTLSNINASNPTATPTSTTTYTLTVTDGLGCTATDNIIVTVNAIPTITINNPTICAGASATLTATPSTGGGTYLWNTTDATQSITYSPGATTTYSCVYTLNGCPSNSVNGTVTVNDVPTITINNPTICAGASATLTATPSTGGGTYLWNTTDATQSITYSPGVTTTYSCVYTLNGCPSSSVNGTVTVNDVPTITINNPIICAGASATLTATPSTGGGTYLWNTTDATQSITYSPGVTTTYSCVYTLNGCSSTSVNGTVTVNDVPTITINNPTICAGASATLTATPSTGGGTYLWNTTATTQSITVSPGVTTTYSCVYTLNGCPSTSVNGTVTVNSLPTFSYTTNNPTTCGGNDGSIVLSSLTPSTSYDVSYQFNGGATTTTNYTSTVGGDITLSTLVAGSYDNITVTLVSTGCNSISVDLSLANPGAPNVNDISNVVQCGGTYTLPTITGTLTGSESYYTGSNGTGTAYSAGQVINVSQTLYIFDSNGGACTDEEVFTITINPIPSITNGTLTQTICSGANATFNPTSNVGGTTFDWTASASAGTITGFSAIGSGNINETINNSAASGTVTYVITPTAASCPGTPVNFVVTVNPVPTITNGTLTQTICSGANATFNPTSNVGGTTFDWTASASAGTITGFSAIGSGNINETINNSAASGTVTYVITPTAASCPGTPVNFIVTVNPIPTITNGTLAQTICSGANATFNPTSNVGGTTFDWTASASAGTITGFSAIGSGNINETINNSAASGTVTYVITPTAASCPGTPVNFVVTVDPVPSITNGTLTQTICSGANATFNPTSNVGGTTFNWTASASSGTITGFSGIGSGNINETINNSAASGTVTYVITPTAAACPGTPVNFVVTVDPVPSITNGTLTQTICSGTNATFNPTSNVGGTTFDWTASASTGTITGFSAIGSGNINETINNSAASGTVTYVITPTAAACPGTPVNFVVTVDPIPTISINNITICVGASATLTATPSIGGGTYSWNTTDVTQSITYSPVTTTTYSCIYTLNGCPSNSVNGVVTVNSIPTIANVVTVDSICSGETSQFILNADIPNSTYTWTGTPTSGNITGYTANGTGNINETLNNNGTTIESVNYSVTPISPAPASCPGNPVTFRITVNPIPVIPNNGLLQTICSGEPAVYNPSSNVMNTTYDWTSSVQTGSITGNSPNGNGNINEVLTNNGTNSGSVVYVVTPVGPSPTFCNGSDVDFVVTVNPPANANFFYPDFCENTSITPTIYGVIGGNFSLNPIPTDGATINASTGEINDAIGSSSYTVQYDVTTGCPGVNSQTVQVHPTPETPNVSGSGAEFCLNSNEASLLILNPDNSSNWYTDANLTDSIYSGFKYSVNQTEANTYTYYVTNISANGCESEPKMVTIILENCEIQIPTAITPDGNSIDDTWELDNIDAIFPDNIVKVYNRWGALLYESEKGNYTSRPWDGLYNGQALPVGSYYFIIEFNDTKKENATGIVSIIKK